MKYTLVLYSLWRHNSDGRRFSSFEYTIACTLWRLFVRDRFAVCDDKFSGSTMIPDNEIEMRQSSLWTFVNREWDKYDESMRTSVIIIIIIIIISKKFPEGKHVSGKHYRRHNSFQFSFDRFPNSDHHYEPYTPRFTANRWPQAAVWPRCFTSRSPGPATDFHGRPFWNLSNFPRSPKHF